MQKGKAGLDGAANRAEEKYSFSFVVVYFDRSRFRESHRDSETRRSGVRRYAHSVSRSLASSSNLGERSTHVCRLRIAQAFQCVTGRGEGGLRVCLDGRLDAKATSPMDNDY